MDVTTASRDELIAAIARLETQVARQEAVIASLGRRIKELEDQRAIDSHNSSHPPSRDWGCRRPRSRRAQREEGGWTTRAPRDHASPGALCGRCGCVGCRGGTRAARRQVIGGPPLALKVVEHQTEAVVCPHCGGTTVGTFPAGIDQVVQDGPQMHMLFVYLRKYQLLPMERMTELPADLFGTAPAPAAVEAAIQRCAAVLRPTEQQIMAAIQGVPSPILTRPASPGRANGPGGPWQVPRR